MGALGVGGSGVVIEAVCLPEPVSGRRHWLGRKVRDAGRGGEENSKGDVFQVRLLAKGGAKCSH